MARARFSQLPPERRREILSLAAEEFARAGFAGTSYNKLLERLGLGKGSAYYYFENKRDLFVTVVVDCYASYFAMLAEQPLPSRVEDFWPHVLGASIVGFEFMLRDPKAAALMRCMQSEPQLLAELASDEVISTLEASYAQLIDLGQSLGAIRRDVPRELLLLVSRNLAASFDQWFAAVEERPSPERIALSFVDMARRMLEPRP